MTIQAHVEVPTAVDVANAAGQPLTAEADRGPRGHIATRDVEIITDAARTREEPLTRDGSVALLVYGAIDVTSARNSTERIGKEEVAGFRNKGRYLTAAKAAAMLLLNAW